jgi:hypothetical protein
MRWQQTVARLKMSRRNRPSLLLRPRLRSLQRSRPMPRSLHTRDKTALSTRAPARHSRRWIQSSWRCDACSQWRASPQLRLGVPVGYSALRRWHCLCVTVVVLLLLLLLPTPARAGLPITAGGASSLPPRAHGMQDGLAHPADQVLPRLNRWHRHRSRHRNAAGVGVSCSRCDGRPSVVAARKRAA